MSDRELIYWANQHGQGIVIKGDLARKIALACELTGETPEEFVMRAVEDWSEKNEVLPSSSV